MTQQTLDLEDDITANYHRGNPESIAANPSPESKELCEVRILRSLVEDGPQTSETLERRLNLRHQSVSARLTGLKKKDLAYKTILQNKTTSGKYAAVIAATPRGHAVIAARRDVETEGD